MQPAVLSPIPSGSDSRRRRPGTALGCLRCWRDLRQSGANPDAREAALMGLSGPISTDPLSKEQ